MQASKSLLHNALYDCNDLWAGIIRQGHSDNFPPSADFRSLLWSFTETVYGGWTRFFLGIMFFWKGSASYLIYFLTLVYAWISINSKRLCRVAGIWRIFVFYYRWIFERLNHLFDRIFHQLPVNFDSVFDWLNSRISYKLKNHHNILSLLQKSVKSTAHFKYYRQIKLNFYNYINNRRFCK